MTKSQAVAMIDDHREKLDDLHDMFQWAWLRAIIDNVYPDEWEKILERTIVVLAK